MVDVTLEVICRHLSNEGIQRHRRGFRVREQLQYRAASLALQQHLRNRRRQLVAADLRQADEQAMLSMPKTPTGEPARRSLPAPGCIVARLQQRIESTESLRTAS